MPSCRFDDVKNYELDMDRISNAMDFASALIGNAKEVRATLDELKSEYSETLEATGAFLAEFANLDDGAISNADTIMSTLRGAQQTLYYLRQAAISDDIQYHRSRGETPCF